ncbi:MAG: serine/threonine-protein kinase, partial [Myxococcota bacterium]
MSDPDRRYQLQRRLGRGGFGEVWLAVREAGGVRSEVAVKLLHEGLDPGAQALQRLRDEGRILGLLNHPVILKVLDLTTLDGRVALVTEYVDGADLQECFVAERMPVRALVEVIGRVADALAVAWSAPSPTGGSLQLLHRDVKPANVRIGRHGDVKLLDFGIARAADPGREAHTKTAALIGTLSYLSPERFDPRHPGGPASDVFALGAVLYEGLAGEQLVEPLSSREQYLL